MKKIILSMLTSLLIITFIIFKLDWLSVWSVIIETNLEIIAIALLFQMSIIYLSAIRWNLFFKEDNLNLELNYILRVTFIGAFFNNVLPSSNGGDAIRGYYIYKKGFGAAVAFSPIITERIIGLVTTLAMAAIFIQFIVIQHEWFNEVRIIIPLIFLLSTICVVLLGIPSIYKMINRLLESKKSYRVIAAILRIIESTHLYFGNSNLMIKISLLSTLIHVIAVLVVWLLAVGVGSDISLLVVIAVTPIIFAISGIPITIGGLGLREGVMITFFVAVGMGYSHAASLAIYFIFILLFASLPGFILFLLGKSSLPLTSTLKVHS